MKSHCWQVVLGAVCAAGTVWAGAEPHCVLHCLAPFEARTVVVRHDGVLLGTNTVRLSTRAFQQIAGRTTRQLTFNQRWRFEAQGELLTLKAAMLTRTTPALEYQLVLERPADATNAARIQRQVYFADFNLADAHVPPAALNDGVAIALPNVWNQCLTRNAAWQRCVDELISNYWRNLPAAERQARLAYYAAPPLAALGRFRQVISTVAAAEAALAPACVWSSDAQANREYDLATARALAHEPACEPAAAFAMLHSTSTLVRALGINVLVQQPDALASLAGMATALDSRDLLRRAAPALPALRAMTRTAEPEQAALQAYAVVLAATPAQFVPDDARIVHWLLNTWYGPHCFAALSTLDRDEVWDSALRATVTPVSKDAQLDFPDWCLFAPRRYAATNVLAVCQRIHKNVLAIDALTRKPALACWYLNVLARVPQPAAITLALDVLRRSAHRDAGVRSIAGSDGVQRAALMHAIVRDKELRAHLGNDTLAAIMLHAPYAEVVLDLQTLDATPQVQRAIAQLSTELRAARTRF
ncbi:MAG: hypothetical protein NTV22_11910 [bacterium]|nr:hypothetical protein [bacterium]